MKNMEEVFGSKSRIIKLIPDSQEMLPRFDLACVSGEQSILNRK